MSQMIIDRRNTTIEYSTNCMIVRTDGEPSRIVPLQHITQLICMHNVQLSTQLIGQLKKRNIDFIVLNQRHHNHSFALFADEKLQLKRRLTQYELQRNQSMRMQLTLRLLNKKFQVIQQEMTRYFEQDSHFTAIAVNALKQANLTEDQVRGIEGALQQRVFEVLRLYTSPELGFLQRNRRPPKDPVNAMLSLSYVMAYNAAIRCATAVGLDSRLGFYHRLSHGRHSLACDMMEPLRPIIESWVIFLFQEEIFKLEDFSIQADQCLLKKEGRLRYYEALDEQLPIWNEQLSAAYQWLVKSLDHLASINGTADE
ncbi:CRISPR-associated endonuclease Cas1 [Oligella urethralis]|uniref:CRISPR-associated endonuclease Cas1 n=1 Tax=Oligella urethralis TaxID=90245 RepID=UPI000E03DF1A|nr:CRISPR-associated endonuclease Cas1 [Oligella urethralis]SUA57393.1 CRISPR-associated endonuclease Cas1 [Oligella urethralis]